MSDFIILLSFSAVLGIAIILLLYCVLQKVTGSDVSFKHTLLNIFKQAVGPGVLQTFSTCAVKH